MRDRADDAFDLFVGAKGDLVDAIRLAEELRAGRLTSVFHEDSKLWDMRTIVTSYLDMTQDLVRSKNRYKSLLRSRGLAATGKGVYTDEALLKSITGNYDRCVAVNVFEQVRLQQGIKDGYEDKFAQLAKEWPVVKRLGSIPGISDVRATIIAAIICSPSRFANKHKLWAYAKLVRYVDVSDGRIYGSRETAGRIELKSVFIGAATTVLQGTSGLERYYDRLRSGGTAHREAKKAVARRIAAIALMVMKTGNSYNNHHDEGTTTTKLAKN